jgi:3D-(3,5/4)-trihydroxycyclohexane-1,2-dione acylhydrolase (decyclizing)
VIETGSLPELKSALQEIKNQSRTTVIVVEVDREERVPGYESWWDVPVAEVSEVEAVQEVYAEYKIAKEKERYLL